MKHINKLAIRFCLILFTLLIAACGGGSDGNDGTGSISMSVTDAKPLLPDNVTNVFIEFSEVWVHKSGGKWQQLALAQSPYIIDLLQFQEGLTTELVPPAILEAGKYTQVRIVVSSATIKFENGTEQPLEIPSDNLKTDKNFTISLDDGSAVDIVIHFDLSKSIVATGSGTYQLKPVVHLFDDPLKAASIHGEIDNASPGGFENATVTVFDTSDPPEIYTQVQVSKLDTEGSTFFTIFWLVPNQSYTLEIDFNQDGNIDCNEFAETTGELSEGQDFLLNFDENLDDNLLIIYGDSECP